MNTYEKIFAFFPSLNFANTLFKKINVKFLYYGYTMFLRVIDCLTHVIIPNKYSRTILIVLKKK